MIPPFNDSGYLPPGIHPAILTEVVERFGQASELRRAQMDSVRWMIDAAIRAGVERIILNGSFVTDIMEPNDVDCVLLFEQGKRRARSAVKQLRSGLPFLTIEVVNQRVFEKLTKFFASDRLGSQKGMIEVIL